MDKLKYSNYINIIQFKLDNKCKYCIWYYDENDDEKFLIINNKIKTFDLLEDAKYFLKQYINYEVEIVVYNIDLIKLDIKNNTINVTNMLEFWNIIIDILKSINVNIEENKKCNNIYDKLFYGQNLPTINTSSKKYYPLFEQEEKEILYNLMTQYIKILNNNIF